MGLQARYLEGRVIRGGMSPRLVNFAYIATNDHDVFVNATRLYQFIKSSYAVPVISRASREGVESIFCDIMHLANSDFVVCTFS